MENGEWRMENPKFKIQKRCQPELVEGQLLAYPKSQFIAHKVN